MRWLWLDNEGRKSKVEHTKLTPSTPSARPRTDEDLSHSIHKDRLRINEDYYTHPQYRHDV
jgi:hypothetical protein